MNSAIEKIKHIYGKSDEHNSANRLHQNQLH